MIWLPTKPPPSNFSASQKISDVRKIAPTLFSISFSILCFASGQNCLQLCTAESTITFRGGNYYNISCKPISQKWEKGGEKKSANQQIYGVAEKEALVKFLK